MGRNSYNTLAGLILLLSFSLHLYGETVIIAADEWEPINGDPDSHMPGYVVELAEIIFSEAGYDMRYLMVPWARAILNVQNGLYDAVIGATIENSASLCISEYFFGKLENDFYTLKDSDFVYSGPASLENERLATILGYKYGEIQPYIDLYRGSSLIDENTGSAPLLSNLRKLLLGRVSVIVEWGPVMEYMAEQNGWSEQIRHAGKGGNSQPLYLGFNKEREDLKKIWDEGFKTKAEDGTLDRILRKYGLNRSIIGIPEQSP